MGGEGPASHYTLLKVWGLQVLQAIQNSSGPPLVQSVHLTNGSGCPVKYICFITYTWSSRFVTSSGPQQLCFFLLTWHNLILFHSPSFSGGPCCCQVFLRSLSTCRAVVLMIILGSTLLYSFCPFSNFNSNFLFSDPHTRWSEWEFKAPFVNTNKAMKINEA